MDAHRPTKVDGRTRHGLSYTVEYRALLAAIGRCHDSTHPAYHNYGGRGISVCRAWRDDPWAFIDHVGDRPGRGYDLDRINNDGNYEPGNVRWITRKENLRNKRQRRWGYNGSQLCATQLAEIAGISVALFVWRMRNGFTLHQAMTKSTDSGPRDKEKTSRNMASRFVTVDGTEYFLSEACRKYGIRPDTAWRRLNVYRWTEQQTFTTPVAERHARS